MASKFWLITLPAQQHVFSPTLLPDGVAYLKGQLELSNETQLLHWQFVCCLTSRRRLAFVTALWPGCHAERTRSEAANDYVWKDDTSVADTRFEIGTTPFRRNQAKDWEVIWAQAKSGDVESIPADVRLRCYTTIRRIEKDYMLPTAVERLCYVYYGRTGTGKSRRAWSEAGLEAYPKDPNTKFWDGYSGQENVVIDEFRGSISISHVLRWLDRYPVIVEIKGGATVFRATKIWITSNLSPRQWYPELDEETLSALMRRLVVREFVELEAVDIN